MSVATAPERRSIVLSPQSTFVVEIVPSGSELVIVRVTVCPVFAVDGEVVKLTVGGLSVIVTGEDVWPATPPLSVTVSVTVYVWAVLNEWLTIAPLPVVPSPKFQE